MGMILHSLLFGFYSVVTFCIIIAIIMVKSLIGPNLVATHFNGGAKYFTL